MSIVQHVHKGQESLLCQLGQYYRENGVAIIEDDFKNGINGVIKDRQIVGAVSLIIPVYQELPEIVALHSSHPADYDLLIEWSLRFSQMLGHSAVLMTLGTSDASKLGSNLYEQDGTNRVRLHTIKTIG